METHLLCHTGTTHGYPYRTDRYQTQPVSFDRPADGELSVQRAVTCDTCDQRVLYHVLSVRETAWWRRLWALVAVVCLGVVGVTVYAFVAVLRAYEGSDQQPGASLALIPLGFVAGLCFAWLFARMARRDPGARGPGTPLTFFRRGHKLADSVF